MDSFRFARSRNYYKDVGIYGVAMRTYNEVVGKTTKKVIESRQIINDDFITIYFNLFICFMFIYTKQSLFFEVLTLISLLQYINIHICELPDSFYVWQIKTKTLQNTHKTWLNPSLPFTWVNSTLTPQYIYHSMAKKSLKTSRQIYLLKRYLETQPDKWPK